MAQKIVKEKKVSTGNSRYQQKVFARVKLARQVKEGFYMVDAGKNKGKRYPKPLIVLQAMGGRNG